MKPLAVLVPGIDKKIITGATIIDDTKTSFRNGKDENYSPKNNEGYLGKVTVRRALESSQNIPFVKMLENITPQTSVKYLKKMGITTLTDKDVNLALALGGIEKGISPLEMASAYATIANDGTYIEPIFYSKITTSNGSTLLKPKQKTKRVFSKSVAYVLKQLLTQPVKGSNGTASNCSISNMDVAAKTGTTDDNYDRWLCGFTNYYTGVTWYGYDLNEKINYSGHQNPASVIWSNVMKSVHSGLSSRYFEKPNDVMCIKICKSTGLEANPSCGDTYDEYFLRGTIPQKCTQHNSKNTGITSNTTNKTENINNSNKNDTQNVNNVIDYNSTTTNTNTDSNTINTTNNTVNNSKNNTNTNTNKNSTKNNTTTNSNNSNKSNTNKNTTNNITNNNASSNSNSTLKNNNTNSSSSTANNANTSSVNNNTQHSSNNY